MVPPVLAQPFPHFGSGSPAEAIPRGMKDGDNFHERRLGFIEYSIDDNVGKPGYDKLARSCFSDAPCEREA